MDFHGSYVKLTKFIRAEFRGPNVKGISRNAANIDILPFNYEGTKNSYYGINLLTIFK